MGSENGEPGALRGIPAGGVNGKYTGQRPGQHRKQGGNSREHTRDIQIKGSSYDKEEEKEPWRRHERQHPLGALWRAAAPEGLDHHRLVSEWLP